MESQESNERENPFEGMKIKDWKVLDKLEDRCVCLKCNKSRKYFCYTCYIPVPTVEEHVPKVKLPVKIDIIKHAREIDGKSTAAHAAVIAPEDVTIYTYPCIPDYPKEENVVLIFPGKNAQSIQEYICSNASRAIPDEEDDLEPKCKRPNLSPKLPISRAVFIDSTWNQSRGIYKDQRLRDIPCVVFQSRISQFWRHQHGSPRWFLATIEAVHQFLVELHICCKLGNNQRTSLNVEEDHGHKPSTSVCEESSESVPHGSSGGLLEKDTKTHSSVTTERVAEDEGSISKVALNRNLQPDKAPSKFVKNLALCRGIRVDPGGDPGIKLLGPEQWEGKYGGEYDNLLFFFQFMYHKIHSIYDHDKLRSYQRNVT